MAHQEIAALKPSMAIEKSAHQPTDTAARASASLWDLPAGLAMENEGASWMNPAPTTL